MVDLVCVYHGVSDSNREVDMTVRELYTILEHVPFETRVLVRTEFCDHEIADVHADDAYAIIFDLGQKVVE